MRYITTPLYYVNARPHLGHAYTTILADVLKRQAKQEGDQAYFLTGTDEHGEKIAQIAEKEGTTPKQLADSVSADFQDTWQKMELEFDAFYRTTDLHHQKAVQYALQLLKDKGEIVFREYEGLYCVGCERFLKETELSPEGHCPDHRKPPEKRKEGNYFFLMSRYQEKLIQHFEKNPHSIQPDHYRHEILSFLKEPLEDLCVTRPKERLTWGIEVPFDARFVTYVWVDALLNYLVATGWPGAGSTAELSTKKFDLKLWSQATHLIAKDILKTHAVYWGALLMALDVPVFKSLQVSGYWLIGGTKMSKSLGNSVRPLEMEALYGKETLRFYLLKEMSYGMDSTFTVENYITAINAYLANGFGNLASRIVSIGIKNQFQSFDPATLTAEDQTLLDKRAVLLAAWNASFSELKYQNALKAWCELISETDLYINNQKPWALAKDPSTRARLDCVLAVCFNTLAALAWVIRPVLPEASQKLAFHLGLIPAIDARQAWDQTSSADCVVKVRTEFKLAPEAPKLFMRMQIPAPDSATS